MADVTLIMVHQMFIVSLALVSEGFFQGAYTGFFQGQPKIFSRGAKVGKFLFKI